MKTPPRSDKTKVTLTVDELNKLVELASFPALNPNPVVELTLDGHIIYANPSAKKLFPKWKSLSLQHPFLRDIKTFLRKTKNANPENHITREVQVNGQTFLQTFTKIPDLARYRIYCSNITSLKETENELKEAQRLGHLGSWDWDSRTDKITWSEEYYRIIGFDPKKNPPGYDEHIKIYTDESARRLDAAVKKAMTKGTPYTLDLEQKRPHGKRGWITARSEVKRDKKNKIIGLRGTAQDITEHMQSKIELERLNRALQMLSETNKTIIHAKNEDDLLKEIREIIVKAGAYHFMWIGFAENDIAKTVRPVLQAGVGEKYLKSAKITWADVERGRGPTGSAIRTGQTQIVRDIENDERMKPWKKALGKLGCISSIAIPLTNEDKSFGALNIYANKVDAFSNKEIEILEELANDLAFGISTIRLQKKVEERTREVDELKNKFIQIVSHQLRTPLNVIRWDLETLLNRERGEMDPAQTETLRGAYAANIEIISRLNDLLTAIDIEENRIRMDFDTIDTMDLFHSVCEEKLQSCHLKKIKGKIIKPKTPLPAIKADAVKIRDVIARLIDNAISYSNEGGSIVVKLSSKKNKVRFEISDTGIGIPSSETSRIFQRFHRGWNASQMKPDASGLSLFIAKNYIEAHHGEIGFSSTEKKKSTFWFELPVA